MKFKRIQNQLKLIPVCILTLLAGTASATIYDLSSGGSDSLLVTGGTGGTALFNTFFDQPAGTGFIDPFLRTQLEGQANDYCSGTVTGSCEQGYNTEGAIQFDTKDDGSHNWTDAIMLGDIPIVTIDGIQYREFLLDINQSEAMQGEGGLLSFDELQFFTTTNPNITGYNDSTNLFGSEADLVWELDGYNGGRKLDQDDWIKLENCKDPGTCGSGDFDLQVLIPDLAFADAGATDYVVLFNRFGDNAGTSGANDGFEEWALRAATAPPPNGTPEPGVLPLVFAGMIAGWMTKRRKNKA